MINTKDIQVSDYRDTTKGEEFNPDNVRLIREHFSSAERHNVEDAENNQLDLASENLDGSYNVYAQTSTYNYAGAMIVSVVDLFRALEEQFAPRLINVITQNGDQLPPAPYAEELNRKRLTRNHEFVKVLKSATRFDRDVKCIIQGGFGSDNLILENNYNPEVGSTWTLRREITSLKDKWSIRRGRRVV